MRNVKFYAIVLVLIVFIGFLSFSPTFSSLINEVVIRNTGQITTKITAKSGSPEDIQAAVDLAASLGGGTVYVPEGTFDFYINPNKIGPDGWSPSGVIIPGGVNVVGMGSNKTILRMVNEVHKSVMFFVDGRETGKPTRISGIKFDGLVTNEDYESSGIIVMATKDFRIDHCDFEDFSDCAIGTLISWAGFNFPHRGVIDHCNFDNPYHDILPDTSWGYGVIVLGGNGIWEPDINKLLGHYDDINNVVYIEDCNFTRNRHAISSNNEGYYVVRYCTFKEPRPKQFPWVDVHGNPGGRGLESYNNTFIGIDYGDGRYLCCGHSMRGGGGVIFNNTFIDCEYGVGMNHDGQAEYKRVYNLYIWDNQMKKQNAPTAGTLINNQAGYVENVNYFLYAKPGYTPYPYPHPLTQSTLP